MNQYLATVTHREQVAEGHHLVEFECPEIARETRPGQFVHVRVSGTYDPLLRRPISVLLRDEHKGRVQILVRAVGRGTEILSQVAPGNVLDVLGPLGNGFPLPEGDLEPLLVAGGVGVAPLIFLADWLQTAPQGHFVRGLFGAATEDALVCWTEFAGRCELFEMTTDDGSAGVQGVVTDLLAEQLSLTAVDMVYACGPRAMLAVAARMCADVGVPCYVSLEQFMGCGVGACLGCVVPTSGEPSFRRVCADGPVFDATVIAWGQFTETADPEG